MEHEIHEIHERNSGIVRTRPEGAGSFLFWWMVISDLVD